MNDRYLCQAKRKSDKKWIYGNLIQTDDGVYIIQNYVPQHLIGKYEVDPSTICQCTGLKDKHGKLIFENDIVRCGKNCTVTWCDTFASWRLNTSGWMYSHFFGEACKPEDVEIVGNIFDNPELLEVGE